MPAIFFLMFTVLCTLCSGIQVWFQNRRAKMRRQLKLQSQLPAEPYLKKDSDQTSEKLSTGLKLECSDPRQWDRQEEEEHPPWTNVRQQPETLKLGKWAALRGLSLEELRSCSIANLRSKAREHEAGIHTTANKSESDTQAQTQETDAQLCD